MLKRMRDNDVVAALNICTTLEEFPAVVAVAEQHAHVFASAGVHPDKSGVEEPTVERLVELADHPRSRGNRRNGPRLLSPRGAARLAALPVSHAHPRGAPVRQAADHPYARRRRTRYV